MSLKPPQKAARRNESNRCRRRQCIGDFSHPRGGLWASGRRARAVGNACVVHGSHPVRRQAHRPLVHSPCRARSARPPPSAHALGLHHLGGALASCLLRTCGGPPPVPPGHNSTALAPIPSRARSRACSRLRRPAAGATKQIRPRRIELLCCLHIAQRQGALLQLL